ncbi:MAG: hypothetical protein A2452_09490 [Candidatus Firestonebacteria bacterium RIFOXYC2_FULL_39_67]|nr:MAG: hypothetical protein A2536_00080 [Candidatus Firestonebacteria bacterium RIFOXYD2_FULL_39_29]OGF55745.1 MAG: hypothetical protein A2452_09490 [Candidatus Firestonebacteria bacterium RIFOXYC2_FULL_39_67]
MTKNTHLMQAGYPDRSVSMDVLPGFIDPPKGYGEVPFYWWQGDRLTRKRLLWQLDQLKNKGISSLQINYSHLDEGGFFFGLSNPSKPALFTVEWWKLFKWFAFEAKKRDMTVSLSDYTLGIGQGFSMDEAIEKNPELNGSMLKNITNILAGAGTLKMPENLLNLTVYKMKEDGSLNINTRKNIMSKVKAGSLSYDFGREKWKVIAVYAERLIPSYDPMHPQSGKAYIKYFFEKFEKALPGKSSKYLNFFFSDELNFRVIGNLWNKRFAKEFKKRKSYDLIPYLDALYTDIGSVTPKIRLDYNDVIVKLSEENFFKPVYQWHQDRGLIYGCDHGGRGKDPEEFGDYFRTQRWNQGPGSDQPNLSKDIIKAKVASSIAHLYNRPRVWLEGFYGSGWGTTSAAVTDAIFANFVAGYNLLSFAALKYSTQGGWWEWAPPCNHFRMPYWAQISPLMDCIQRLSYLLSQGYHNCDVAIIYPTEPVIAGLDGKKSVNAAFEAGERLYDKGIDFDFIDFESLACAGVKDKELQVAGEKYKVLVIPSMKVMRYSSLRKIEEFKNAGGLIVNIGDIPEATEKCGSNDAKTSELIAGIFAKRRNILRCQDAKIVPSIISGKYQANFKILSALKERPYVVHRIIGKRDVYALYNFPAGSRCFFKAKGAVTLWDPWKGGIASLSDFAVQTNEGTELTLPLSKKEIQIIVFDPENTGCKNIIRKKKVLKEITLDNTWEFEIKPSLDNQWGDFKLPAGKELLGAEVRQLYSCEDKEYAGEKIVFDKNWKNVTCAYGPQFQKLGALPVLPFEEELIKMKPQNAGTGVKINGKKYLWEEYAFSWQHGVEDDPGHQGWHGLKGQMYDDFIRLGALGELKHSKKRFPEPSGNYYILYTSIIAPFAGVFDLLTGNEKPIALFVNNSKTDVNSRTIILRKGANPVLLVYNKACETYFLARKPKAPYPKKQPVSMRWYKDYGVLPFDCSIKKDPQGLFAFESTPGLRSFTFSAYGKVTIWIDGVQIRPIAGQKQLDGLTGYIVNLKDSKLTSSLVVLKIKYQPGYRGAGAIPAYFRQQCGKGSINLGDWSKIDGLKSYSGGAWYRKTVDILAADLKNKLEIDLGELVSSVELYVNGKSVGIKLSPPWTFDITQFAKESENQIGLLIYNTLSNNYIAIPTRYRGELKSGLIGPVIIKICR